MSNWKLPVAFPVQIGTEFFENVMVLWLLPGVIIIKLRPKVQRGLSRCLSMIHMLNTELTIPNCTHSKGRRQNSSVASGDILQRMTNAGW